jgi:hypothetical protein
LLPAQAEDVVVDFGSAMVFLPNTTDPGLGTSWVDPSFDDSTWQAGIYGVGFETAPPGAQNLLLTTVPSGSRSVFTRATFNITDVSQVNNLFLGCDFDDGFVAWINGVEVFRSTSMPVGSPAWNTSPSSHESSNGLAPTFEYVDISISISALQNGPNTLAIGVWDAAGGTSDLVLVPNLTTNKEQGLVRGPYLQMGTHDSIVVRWRTALLADSQVLCGPDPLSLTSCAESLNLETEHELQLSGLTPATKYFYAIGTTTEVLAGGDADHFFVTAPTPGVAVPTRIWVLGDSGTGTIDQFDVRDAYYAYAGSTHTNLWLMLGDNVYDSGYDFEYQTRLFDVYPEMLRKSVLWTTLGNHDAINADSATQSGPYYDNFTMPTAGEAGGLNSGTEAYYSFDYGNIHFVVLDSHETNRLIGGAMMTWLAADLAATTSDWTIAFWHHPPYSKGSHNSDTETRLIEMRENAMPILDDSGADLTLTGHSHNYERSFLIEGHYGDSTTFVPSMKIDGGDGQTDGTGAYMKPILGPDPNEGMVHTIAGSSGQVTPGGSLDHPAMFISMNILGSLVLDVSGNQLDATFLDETGAIQDHFTIVKGPLCSVDTDQDAVCESIDNCPLIYNPGQLDADGDRVGDLCDTCPADSDNDIDGDGVCGDVDNCPAEANAGQQDGDGDGLGNICDPCPNDPGNDSDGDTLCGDVDNCPEAPNIDQTDTDGDGQGDACDPFPNDPDNDLDGDRVGAADNCLTFPNPGQGDTDGDGAGDFCDSCPLDALDDADVDGKCADVDNCPSVGNASQTDTDSDGLGDVCDACANDADNDFDGDLVCGNLDNCEYVSNPLQTDTDMDGHGDACDVPTDTDFDGVRDNSDNCPTVGNPLQTDTDADGSGDACDLDDDDDTVVDSLDCSPGVRGVANTVLPVGDTLRLDKTAGTTLGWIPGANALVSNVYRAFRADGGGFFNNFVCFDAGNVGSNSVDSEDPMEGETFFYVVASENACGEWPPGMDSYEIPRSILVSCPTPTGDADQDGVPDIEDNCPVVYNDDCSDVDADFVGDVCDNCPEDANATQADTDLDGLGDACAWWNSSWQNRVKITFDNETSAEDLIDFPALVTLDITLFQTQIDGRDLRFIDPASPTTELAYEIEQWADGGVGSVWVKIPEIRANSTNDYVWMYYNNPAATTNPRATTEVWNSGYSAVWHMGESSGMALDSTSNHNDGAFVGGLPNLQAGKTGNAQELDGLDDHIEVPGSPSLSPTSAVSIGAWLKPTWAEMPFAAIIYQDWIHNEMIESKAIEYALYPNGKIGMQISEDGSTRVQHAASTTIVLDAWNHVVTTFDSGIFNVYFNGVVDKAEYVSADVTAINVNSTPTMIGIKDADPPNPTFPFMGLIDEMRFSNVARSGEWVRAEYKSQTGELVTIGCEQNQGSMGCAP